MPLEVQKVKKVSLGFSLPYTRQTCMCLRIWNSVRNIVLSIEIHFCFYNTFVCIFCKKYSLKDEKYLKINVLAFLSEKHGS